MKFRRDVSKRSWMLGLLLATWGFTVSAQNVQNLDQQTIVNKSVEEEQVINNTHQVISNFWNDNWFVVGNAGINAFWGDYGIGNLSSRLTPQFNIGFGKWFVPGFGAKVQLTGFRSKENKSEEIKDFKITNIVVLLNTETEYAGYWNHNFNLIGIFNQRLKEENINFDSIAVSSFNITSMIHYGQYDGELITNFDVVFIENPFEKHIKNALKPVKKAINKNIPKQMNFTSSFEDVMDNVNIHQRMALSSTYNIRRFKDFLLDVKELDENISNNLFNKYGTSKFNPEDYKD